MHKQAPSRTPNLMIGMVLIAAFVGTLAQSVPLASAGTIEQTFTHSWSQVQRCWDHQAYETFSSSLGVLDRVEVEVSIMVSGLTAGDTFSYRAIFFTGWNPAVYQLNLGGQIPCEGDTLEITKSVLITDAAAVACWVDPLVAPDR